MPRPVLLLHPLGSDGRFWDGMPFPQDRKWLALDMPGHGAEPPPAVPDGIAGFADRAVELADQAGVDDFDVVGVSLGGLVAQHLAVQRPGRVGRVVLVDTVATYPEPMRAMWIARAATARKDGMTALVAPTLDIWFGPAFRQSRPDVIEKTIATLLRTDPEGYARTCEVLAAVDLSDGILRLPTMTLTACGNDDADPFRDAAEAISAATGRPVQWLPGKHAAVLENPALFTRHLVSFLDAVPQLTATDWNQP